MGDVGVCCDTVSFNAAISACAKGGGQWRHALALMRRMLQQSFTPNVITFSSTMDACARAG
eukprot:2947326-Pyramimonas_sp.AAC.1